MIAAGVEVVLSLKYFPSVCLRSVLQPFRFLNGFALDILSLLQQRCINAKHVDLP